MAHVLDTLRERGFVAQVTDEEALRKRLEAGPVTFYLGIDPTGKSLHAGHMVPLYMMTHLAAAGHSAIALMGGGTARIGDPSGKIEMRKMLSIEQINANAESMREQVARFLSIKNT
ncbi:MAG: tyrosine--tRNA ligase, partial [Alkalispirochaetaceae bacterium]